jgi:hypothetical protein
MDLRRLVNLHPAIVIAVVVIMAITGRHATAIYPNR